MELQAIKDENVKLTANQMASDSVISKSLQVNKRKFEEASNLPEIDQNVQDGFKVGPFFHLSFFAF